jgi:DNA-binding NtrC family response regulator
VSVHLDDPRMSSKHARLTKLLRRWVIEDMGSKNGIRVNGVEQTRAALADGDLLEVGRTFFVFRDPVPCEAGAPAIRDIAAVAPPAPGFTTLLPALEREFARFAAIAGSGLSVLIEGETGTGKEVLARALHEISERKGEFVAVNCGALPRDLVEAELFGHRKGAFSGALEDRPGLVRSADKGTLFLDEIGDLPASAQAVLLRVLQEREVRPIGGTRAVAVDLRVVAATHHSLDKMVSAGNFRADLLGRLAGHRFTLPPLCERLEDMGLLIGGLLARLCADRAAVPALHPLAARALLRHEWPLNVRELEQCLRSALVLARAAKQELINLEHLPAAVQRAVTSATREDEDAVLREELVLLLRKHRGNITAVAQEMGKARMQIQRWLKRVGVDPEEFRR